MKISILIPVYGQPDLARAAIMSASRYLGAVDEIRVVDDNPDDPLVRHHPDVINASDRIKYEINPANQGRAETYNRLLHACTTDLFLMLDGDDFLAEAVDFKKIIRQFEAHPDLVLVCGRCCEVSGDETLRISGPRVKGLARGLEYLLAWVGADNLFPHSACIVKKSAAVRCHGYPLGILNSDIALLRLVLLEGDALAIDTLVSYWRFHGGNASRLAEPNLLIQNFGSILIPYNYGGFHNLYFKLWLVRNTRMYLVSALHQIVGAKAGGVGVHLVFYLGLMRILLRETPVALVGVLAALPKILALILLRQIIGHSQFAKIMARRGNYVYFDS